MKKLTTTFVFTMLIGINTFAQKSILDSTIKGIGTLADCNIILCESCQKYLLQANAKDILSQAKDAFIFEGKKVISNAFSAKIVEATGAILSAELVGDKIYKVVNSYRKPAIDIKWGDSPKKIIKQYGEPDKIRLDFNSQFYTYKNVELGFFTNKLRSITFSRAITETEIAAQKSYDSLKSIAASIAARPENRLVKIYTDQLALDLKLDKYVLRINEAIKRYNSELSTYGNTPSVKNSLRDIKILQNEAISLIDIFFKKYGNEVSAKATESLLQTRKNLDGDKLKPFPF